MTTQVSKLLVYINHRKLVKKEPVAENSIKDSYIKTFSMVRETGVT